MIVYEYLKKKLFLHRKIEATELEDTDLLQLFKTEVADELGVNDQEKGQGGNYERKKQ